MVLQVEREATKIYSQAEMDAAISKAQADTWDRAIEVAQESTKKSISAKLDVAAAEILIRRLEAAAQSEKGK